MDKKLSFRQSERANSGLKIGGEEESWMQQLQDLQKENQQYKFDNKVL